MSVITKPLADPPTFAFLADKVLHIFTLWWFNNDLNERKNDSRN